MFYDALLLLALWFVASFAMLPLTGGEAILTANQGILGHLYHALLLTIAVVYFGLCWTRGGQTLGMKAWRIRLETVAGRAPRWPDALLRFSMGTVLVLAALIGAWYLRSGGAVPRPVGALLILPALANLAWIRVTGHSLQDLAGRLRVVRWN